PPPQPARAAARPATQPRGSRHTARFRAPDPHRSRPPFRPSRLRRVDPPARFGPSITIAPPGQQPAAGAADMILLIDNYDSFTWNLVHLLGEAGAEVAVHRNDSLTVADAMVMGAAGLVISPGPCDPGRAGICVAL